MKKIINITSYILSVIFILTSTVGIIYFVRQKNKIRNVKGLPTIAYILNELDIPVMEIDGDTDAISKENKVNVYVKYHSTELNFDTNATIKWQGASSLYYDKKNYNITFVDENGEKNKIKIKDEWGKENKYCLKANYIDHSSARNVVSAKLYGEIVHSRNKGDELDQLVNGGAIDGFPIVIYMNNEYQGIYTFNTPKDKWIFDMDKNDHKAILMADQWSDSTSLKTPISSDFLSSGWELEHCSTEDSNEGTAWVTESFNDLIEFVNENDGDDFINNVANYVDLERTIDTMLFTLIINGRDNLSKNILWVTYDGVVWVPSAYDLDTTWGLYYNGEIQKKSDWLTLDEFKSSKNTNMLWKKILSNFEQDVIDRYFELRQDVLSFENISYQFSSFSAKIPTELYGYETKLYPDIPSQRTSNLSQILYFAQENLKNLDVEFENL